MVIGELHLECFQVGQAEGDETPRETEATICRRCQVPTFHLRLTSASSPISCYATVSSANHGYLCLYIYARMDIGVMVVMVLE